MDEPRHVRGFLCLKSGLKGVFSSNDHNDISGSAFDLTIVLSMDHAKGPGKEPTAREQIIVFSMH